MKTIYIVILTLVISILVITTITSIWEIGNLIIERDYYRGQMTTFCELEHLEYNALVKLGMEESERQPCEYWLLTNDTP